MTEWWVESPEASRVLAEERAVVDAAELVSAGLERTGLLRAQLAARLGVSPSELSQRLSGRRNLTVKSLAAMVHELGCDLEIGVKPRVLKNAHFTSRRGVSWPGERMRYTQTGVQVRSVTGAA